MSEVGKIEVALTFRVFKSEYDKYLEWRRKLPKRYSNLSPVWKFRGTGIGDIITVSVGDRGIDVTDVSRW